MRERERERERESERTFFTIYSCKECWESHFFFRYHICLKAFNINEGIISATDPSLAYNVSQSFMKRITH
jgi:hypothetical protein